MKMKYIIAPLVAYLMLGNLVLAQSKVGYTNVELILTYMPETKLIEKEMETLQKKLEEQLLIKQKYYQQKLLEYMEAKQKNLLTAEQDQWAVTELGKLEGEVQQGLKAAEEKLLTRRMTLLKPLQDKIQGAIDAVAKEGGYAFILNNSVGGGVPSILYGDESEDVTVRIAKKLGIEVTEN